MSSRLDLRRRSRRHADSGEALWAVSYADLLMVLLSFFVIYFEMGSDAGSSPMKLLLAELRGSSQAGQSAEGSGNGVDAGGAGISARAAGLHAELQTSLRAVGEVSGDPELPGALLLHLSADCYRKGSYRVEGLAKEQLDRVFEVLAPHRDRISLVFFGNADAAPVRPRPEVQSNLMLSNLRASAAADYAVARNFDPRHISTQGFAEYNRATRSISIRVAVRGSP